MSEIFIGVQGIMSVVEQIEERQAGKVMFTIEDGRYSNGFYKRQDQKTGAQINPFSGSSRTLETR